VNKDYYARLRFLVNEEHAGAKPVRCGPDPGLGVLMLRSVLCEFLVGGDKVAGSERFASARVHDDAHGASSSTAEPTVPAITVVNLRRSLGLKTTPKQGPDPRPTLQNPFHALR
jgi:hypothetical protein